MNSLHEAILSALGAAYLTYVLTISNARPNWWRAFQVWWYNAVPAWEGKPFGCPVCMSLWTSLWFYLLAGPRLGVVSFLLGWWATAGLCLLLVQVMGWLRK